MNKIKAIVCAALTLCMVAVPLSSSVVFNAGAEDVQSLQSKIDELDSKSAEYQKILDETQTDINEKEKYSEALVSKIQVLDEKIILTRESIKELNTGIEDKKKEIDKSNEEIEGQIDALCERLRLIYMAGSASNLEILLGAKDFDDFIDKMSLVKTLSEYDKKMIDDINDKLDVIEAEKANLEKDKADLEAQEAVLESDLGELNDLVKENQAVLNELTEKNSEARTALQNTNSQVAELEAQIAAEFEAQEAARRAAAASEAQQQAAKQQAAEQQKQAAQQQQQQQQQNNDNDDYDDDDGYDSGSGSSGGGGNTDSSGSSDYSAPVGGGYLWPCPGFFYLSSLWNEDRYTYNHGAIDIAGGDIYGAEVVAADSGTVIYTCTYCDHDYGKYSSCGCGGGFGNYVWIDHGNGKETIYAHLSSVGASPGQTVSQGQYLGRVGSTGYSTGPHLHFECRYDGVKYNPMTELSGYWGMVSY